MMSVITLDYEEAVEGLPHALFGLTENDEVVGLRNVFMNKILDQLPQYGRHFLGICQDVVSRPESGELVCKIFL